MVDPSLLGVRLQVFQDLVREARTLQASTGPRLPGARYYGSGINPRPAGEPLTTFDVCEELIKPRTLLPDGSSAPLVRTLPSQLVAVATIFVSHAWRYTFASVVAAIERAALPMEHTLFWFDLFANDQHAAVSLPYEWWTNTFRESIRRIGRTLLVLAPVFDPIPLTRAWCLFEIHATASVGSDLLIEMPPEEAAAFEEAFLYRFDDIAVALGRVDLVRAECFNATDKANIHRTVRENVGFHALNVQVMEVLRSWLRSVADAAVAKANARVREALASEGRVVHSDLDYPDKTDGELHGQVERISSGLQAVVVRDREEVPTTHPSPSTPKSPTPIPSAVGATPHGAEPDGYGGTSAHIRQLERDRQTLMIYLGRTQLDAMDAPAAECTFRAALAGRQRVFGHHSARAYSALDNVASSLARQSRLAEAEQLFRQALAGLEATLGPHSVFTARTMNSLAAVLHETGHYDESIDLLRRAVAIAEKEDVRAAESQATKAADEVDSAHTAALTAVAGACASQTHDSDTVLAWRANLARTLHAAGHASEAEAELRTVVAAQEARWGEGYAATRMPISHLAAALEARGALEEAERLRRRALLSREKDFGEMHPEALKAKMELASCMVGLGRERGDGNLRQKGMEMARTALADLDVALGRHHRETLAVAVDLVRLLRAEGTKDALSEAASLGAATVEGLAQLLGATHPTAAIAAVNHCMVLKDLGRAEEGVEAMSRLRPLTLQQHGASHATTALVEGALGACLDSAGRLQEALPHLRAAAVARAACQGVAHSATHQQVHTLADALDRAGCKPDAVEELRKLLAAEQKAVRVDPANTDGIADPQPDSQAWTPTSLRTASSLAWLEHENGNSDEARRLFQLVLDERTASQPAGQPDTPVTTQAAINLAFVLKETGDALGAARLHERALEAREARLGAEHADTVRSMLNAAVLLREAGRAAEAELHARRALARHHRVLGASHRDSWVAGNHVAKCCEALGRLEEAEDLYRNLLAAVVEHDPNHEFVPVLTTSVARVEAARHVLLDGTHGCDGGQ